MKSSIKRVLPKGPSHGVSGYACLGIMGEFDIQAHTKIPQINTTNSSVSRYCCQDHCSAGDIMSGTNKFNPYVNPPGVKYTTPQINPSANISEPTLGLGAGEWVASSSQGKTLDARASRSFGKSLLSRRVHEGFMSMDPAAQTMLIDKNTSIAPNFHYAPVTKITRRHRRIYPRSAIRPNMTGKENGTENQTYRITIGEPPGRSDFPGIVSWNTPTIQNESQIAAGTHPSIGDSMIHGIPHTSYDESAGGGAAHPGKFAIKTETGSQFPFTPVKTETMSPFPTALPEERTPRQFVMTLGPQTSTPYQDLPSPPQPDIRPAGHGSTSMGPGTNPFY